MQLGRVIAFAVALTALAAVGSAVALLLLSTIGGAPADDPVGRLRPVASVPGRVTTETTTPLPSAETMTVEDDDHGGRGRDDERPDEDDD